MVKKKKVKLVPVLN